MLGFLWLMLVSCTDELNASDVIMTTENSYDLSQTHHPSIKTTARISENLHYKTIINPHNFTYILNNPLVCQHEDGKDIDLLIWVHSAPGHHKQRLTIRETWGNRVNFKKHSARLVFFIGYNDEDNITQSIISYENEKYNDIIQEDYVDSYRNMTYKIISGAKWVTKFCSKVKVIVKTDDDVMIDIHQLMRMINIVQNQGKLFNNTIMCKVSIKVKPEKHGKWKISDDEYSSKFYPPYCPGYAFVMTGDIVPKLLNESMYHPYFWIDDVYFTGILAERIGTKYITLKDTYEPGPERITVKRISPGNHQRHYIFTHVHVRDFLYRLWLDIQRLEKLRRMLQGTVYT